MFIRMDHAGPAGLKENAWENPKRWSTSSTRSLRGGLLARDISNVCAFFARVGIRADPIARAGELWRRFMRAQL